MLNSRIRHFKHKAHYQGIGYNMYMWTPQFLTPKFQCEGFVQQEQLSFEISAVTALLLLSLKDSQCANKLSGITC